MDDQKVDTTPPKKIQKRNQSTGENSKCFLSLGRVVVGKNARVKEAKGVNSRR